MNPIVRIASNGIEMTISLLLLSVILLYLIMSINKYRLNKTVSLCSCLSYLILIIACIRVQMIVFHRKTEDENGQTSYNRIIFYSIHTVYI